MVTPDGPSTCDIAYLGEAPAYNEVKEGLSFVGYAGAKLWGMAGAVGLPYRRKNKLGLCYGPSVSDDGRVAWVGNVIPIPIKEELKGREIDRQLKKWIPKLQLPKAKVYITVGDIACRALVSGQLPTTRRANYKSIMRHATSIVPASEAKGLLSIPPGSYVIPMRHTAALLHGSDEWFPSCKLALSRAAFLLTSPQPKPPNHQFFLESTNIEEPLEAAMEEGAYAIDLETPITQHIPNSLYIGSIAVGNRVWVFGADDFVRLATHLFKTKALCIVQNGATFDLPVLSKQGLALPRGGIFDTRWVDAILRPRMPHELAHMAAHLLPWAPFNWKWEAEDIFATSLAGQNYCAKDAWHTWHIAKVQQAEIERRGLQDALQIRTALLPTISTVAVKGVKVDRSARRRLRQELVTAVDELTSEVNDYLKEWAELEKDRLSDELAKITLVWQKFRTAGFKNKGVAARKELGLENSEAARLWAREKAKIFSKEKIAPIKKRIIQLTDVRPSQTAILGEFLFTHPRGLQLKPAGKTKTGLPKVGREDLEKVSRRADVAALLKKGDERPKILLRIADANRVGGELGTHLGVLLDKKTKKYDLTKDAQLRRDGRLSIIYNPVRKRFSAGRGKSDKPVASSYQSHNIPSKITVWVRGRKRSWNLRQQIVADRSNQGLSFADWKKMEQFIMAWQAGDRIGYWDWLKDLYAGLDTHAQMAAAVVDGCPATTTGAKEHIITLGGREWTGYQVGKQTNHAMALGASHMMLHTKYDIPVKDAKEIVARFDASPRGQAIRELHSHIQQEVIDTKQVMTPFGEPVDFWNLGFDGFQVRVKDPKGAYSVAQQDTAAIMMMKCLPEIDRVAKEGGGRFLIQTHDEFVYCYSKGKGGEVNEKVKAIMEQSWDDLPVPFCGRGLSIPVSITTGSNWGNV